MNLNQYGFKILKFKNIDFSDQFLDSFKQDYPCFMNWIKKKLNKKVFAFYSEGKIKGFIYLEERDININYAL